MKSVGNEIAGERERLVSVALADSLRAPRVPLDAIEPDSGNDLYRFVDQLELPYGFERRVVIGKIRAARPLVGVHRVFPLEALEHVARARERGNDVVAVAVSVSARVIEVQVRVDHERDLGRPNPSGLQLVKQAGPLDAKDLALLRGEL